MAKKKFYAVASGRKVGIFSTWDECERQIKGFSNAKFKGFKFQGEAEAFLKENGVCLNANAPPLEQRLSVHSDSPPAIRASKRARIDSTPHSLTFHVSFDGGSRGNPGDVAGAGAEVIRYRTTSREPLVRARAVSSIRGYILPKPPQTNNQAEYYGLLLALENVYHNVSSQLMSDGATIELSIQGDSRLIIEQMKGAFQVRSPTLKKPHQMAQTWLSHLRKLVPNLKVSFQHVYRNNNAAADGLANEAMDAKRSWIVFKDENGEEITYEMEDISPTKYDVSQQMKCCPPIFPSATQEVKGESQPTRRKRREV